MTERAIVYCTFERHVNTIFSFFSSQGRGIIRQISCAVIFSICVIGLTGCGGDSGPTPGSLTITTTSLPPGTINQPYSTSVTGSGGAPPYTWSVSPALPNNLTFDTATGAITGTPMATATTTHTFTLRDSSAPSQTVEQSLSLPIQFPLSLTSTSLPDASIAAAYNQPVQTVGGIGALSFSIVQPGTGTLPQYFTLNPTTGLISGTPTAPANTFPFTVRVADTVGQQDEKALSIRVNPTTPPVMTTTSLPGGTVSQPYNQRVQATGGIGTLVWAISAGSLPVGLILESSGPMGGTISGTPTTVGTSNFTVMVTDTFNQTAMQNLSITVGELLFTLTVSKSGNGNGLVTSLPLGIGCGGACQAVFPRNTVVTLTAAPNDFSRFNQWSGIGCSGNGQCILTMDGDKQVDAKFDVNLIFGFF